MTGQGEPLAVASRVRKSRAGSSGKFAAIQADSIARELDYRRRRVVSARALAHVDEQREASSLRGSGAGYGAHLADNEARREGVRLERAANAA